MQPRMRTIRLFLASVCVWLVAGCGCDTTTMADMAIDANMQTCPVGVELSSASTPVACGGQTSCVDQTTLGAVVCQCVCGSYWDCNQTGVISCGPDGGTRDAGR
jgi:hypothetical protein